MITLIGVHCPLAAKTETSNRARRYAVPRLIEMSGSEDCARRRHYYH